MSSTEFYIVNGKFVQNKNVPSFYRSKNDKPVYVINDGESFEAELKAVKFDTNYNGSTYVTWVSRNGTTYYSNIYDYGRIVTKLNPDTQGYYSGTFKFGTRGGMYRSLTLAANNIVPEPVSPLE